MPEVLREVAVGLFKKVLGKEKVADSEVAPVDAAALEVAEESRADTAEAATSGAAETSGNGHGTVEEDLPAWKVEAREFGDKGQTALESGDGEEAVLHLLEALKLYEAHEEETKALMVSRYLGVALYELGRQTEAVSVWEEIISRGCEEKPVYELLIDHYKGLERGDDVARVRLLMDSIG